MSLAGLEHEEIAIDMKATLAARRELGPEMDDELVELLLARVDGYISSQVAGQVADRDARIRARQRTRTSPPVERTEARPWRGFLMLAGFLLLGSIVFGVHVPIFPPVAVAILLILFFSRRGCQGNRASRQL